MTQRQKLVSVVIATHNAAPYLPLAIRSALEQTSPVTEIHVVDDGSTDGTRQAMEPFRDHPGIIYHYQAKRGQASAKNAGIRASRGDYVAFLDADDVWMPRKLERQLPLFDRSDRIGVVHSRRTFIDQHGDILPTPPLDFHRGTVTARLLVANFVGFSTAVVRRECFEQLGGFDEAQAMGDDHDMWLRISTKYDFDYLEESTSYYRVWPRQLSNDYMKRFECRMALMQRFLRQHPSAIDEETIKEAWATAYVGRGYQSARIEGKRFEAFRDFLCALRFRPLWPLAWKELLKLLIRNVYQPRPLAPRWPVDRA